MTVDFFGNEVRCETDGLFINLTDLARAGNQWRAASGKGLKTLANILSSTHFEEFLEVASKDLKKPKDEILKVTGKGNNKRTMGHVTLAIYIAQQFSTEFHYKTIKVFLEGELLKYREWGGTEFVTLNIAIDTYLPERFEKDGSKKNNKGIFINVAKQLREKILGAEATTDSWNKASPEQTRQRYECEKQLSLFLQKGFIKNYDHLKSVIDDLL